MRWVLAAFVLCCLAAPTSAQPSDAQRSNAKSANAKSSQRNTQLGFLDADAGMVIALDIRQLAAAHKLATQLLPTERQTINLAGLGASAILGFYPFDSKAWSASGFDIKAPLLVQVSASRADASPVRTRAVLKVRAGDKGRRTIERMRLQEKARLSVAKEPLAPLFVGMAKTPPEDELRGQLAGAGVFMVAKPRPLGGLLFAREQGGFIVLDIFAPGSQDFAGVLQIIKRRPEALTVSMPGAEALLEGPVGIWIRASHLATTFARTSEGETKRHQACQRIAALGRTTSIRAVGVQIDIGRKSVSLSSRWHLRPEARLAEDLRVERAPRVGGQHVLDAQINLRSFGALRDRKRPAEASSWDALWAHGKACGQSSKAYAIAVAWPEILGLFLSEVSVLHPSATTAIDSLGGMSATADQSNGTVSINTEAWVRNPGADIAKGWLRTLFGSEQITGDRYQWGLGAIQPYAIDGEDGSVIGAGYRKGSRDAALRATRTNSQRATPAATNGSSTLASLAMKPSKLLRHLPTLPGAELWKLWKEASATLTSNASYIEFRFSVRR